MNQDATEMVLTNENISHSQTSGPAEISVLVGGLELEEQNEFE